MISGEFATKLLPLATAAALGGALLSGCGGNGEATPDAPVATGAGVHEGGADDCRMVLVRDGDAYKGHAEVNGTVAGGSKLVYHFTYHGKGLNAPYKTAETTVAADATVSAPATRQGAALWALVGKIDKADSRVNLGCDTAYLGR